MYDIETTTFPSLYSPQLWIGNQDHSTLDPALIMNHFNHRQTHHLSSVQTSVHNSWRPSSIRETDSPNPSHLPLLLPFLPIETSHVHPHSPRCRDLWTAALVAMTTRVCHHLNMSWSIGRCLITTMPTLGRFQVWRVWTSLQLVHHTYQREVRWTKIIC